MEALLKAAASVAAPITLVAFLAVVALAFYRRSVKDRRGLEYLYNVVSSKLTREQFYRLAGRIVTAALVFAIVLLVLAFGSWSFDRWLQQSPGRTSRERPVLRITYVTIAGYAVKPFLTGGIPRGWHREVDGAPLVAHNATLDLLSQWANTYIGETEPSFFPEEGDAIPESFSPKDTFVGSRSLELFWYPTIPTLHRFLSGAPPRWNCFWARGNSEDNGYDSILWKFATARDIDVFKTHAREWYDFYRGIKHLRPPNDLAVLHVSYNECGDEPFLELTPRRVALEILSIENVGNAAVELGDFSIRHSKSDEFRTIDADHSQLSQSSAITAALFPSRFLRSGERFLVPLRIRFHFDRDEFVDELMKAEDPVPLKVSGANAICKLDVGGLFKTDCICTAPADQQPDARRLFIDYVAGPSIRVDKIVADGVETAVRERESRYLTIRGGFEYGSCPYIFTRDDEKSRWTPEGRILIGRVGVARRGTDVTLLHRFDGALLIKELESEVTYIDGVQVDVIMPDGQRVTLRRSDHGNVNVRIRRSEEHLVRFILPHDLPTGSQFVARVSGYYERY